MIVKTINIDGQLIRIAIREGTSVPLLFFNGIGASIELVLPFLESLPPEQTFIAFDVPGVGGSPAPLLPYRFSGLSKIVAQMLEQLNYEQVDVLGLSWGGMLAQQFAYDQPKLCRKLILAATCAGVTSVPPSIKVLSLMASPKRYTDAEYAASIAADIYGGKFRTDKLLTASYTKKMSQSKKEFEHSQLGYVYQMMAVYWWSSLWMLRNIKQPTLVLAGNDDPLIALVNMELIAKFIPNSEMRVFDDGHLFLLTDTQTVVPIIQEFLM